MSERPYEIVETERHHIGRLEVVKDTLLINGNQYPFTYVIHKDSVCVLAIYEGKVIVIDQYRHSIDKWMLELPCGGVDEGEDKSFAAQRELLEETGYVAGELIPLGEYYMNQGISRAKCDVYFTICSDKREQKCEKTEFISVKEIPIDRFEDMICKNEFKLLVGIAAWNAAKCKGYVKTEELN